MANEEITNSRQGLHFLSRVDYSKELEDVSCTKLTSAGAETIVPTK
jgi:hypothetical protein